MSRKIRLAVILSALAVTVHPLTAACVNRFVSRTDRQFQVVTLLTGKLTFQEAQTLAEMIQSKQAPRLEWLDHNGKLVAAQFGPLKVVRPMPVGCDGKASGVVMIAQFSTAIVPAKTMNVKLDSSTTVTFEQQQ